MSPTPQNRLDEMLQRCQGFVGAEPLAVRMRSLPGQYAELATGMLMDNKVTYPDYPLFAYRVLQFTVNFAELERGNLPQRELLFRLVSLADWCDLLPAVRRVSQLFEVLCECENPNICVASAECLGRLEGDTTALGILLQLIRRGEEPVVRRAIEAGERILRIHGWLVETRHVDHDALSEPMVVKEFLSEILRRRSEGRETVPDDSRKSIYVVDIAAQLVEVLKTRPEVLYEITPSEFEGFICNRLAKMRFGVQRVGSSTYRKDGGIDIICWPEESPIPFLVAVQVKHHRTKSSKTGPTPVREMISAFRNLPFNAGMLVTNTTFTPDARWLAGKMPHLIKLRDIVDLRRWIADNFLRECEWRELPAAIEVCPGVKVDLPPMLQTGLKRTHR